MVESDLFRYYNRNALNQYRLPFSRSPIGFSVAVLISFAICYSIAIVFVALTVILIGICINVGEFIDDISVIISHAKQYITHEMTIKRGLKQVIELHLQCYRY